MTYSTPVIPNFSAVTEGKSRLSISPLNRALCSDHCAREILKNNDSFIPYGIEWDGNITAAAETAAAHEDNFRKKKPEYGDYIQGYISSGLLIPATVYLHAQRQRGKIIDDMIDLIKGYDCVICPSTVGTAPEGLEWTGSPAFNAPWSLTGLPSITVPMGLAPNKLPLGLQLIGPPYKEWNLLKVAGWCEEKLGFDTRPRDPYVPKA